MRKISTISLSTFRESIREKLLYVALLFGGILMMSTYVLSPLAVGARQKIVLDVGLAAISLFGVLTAILVGSTLVHKEIEKKAIHMVFTRPVRRFEYLIGKYFGMAFAIALVIAIMTAAMVFMLLVTRIEIRPAVFAAVYLSVLEMAVMCSIVLFFSTFTTPILTSLFSLCFFVAGSLSNDLRAFSEKFGGTFMKQIADGLYYLLPNLKVFNLRHEAVHDLYITGSEVMLPTLYAVVYCAVILFFAHLIFRRREFV